MSGLLVPVVGGAPDAAHQAVVAIVQRRELCESAEDLVCTGVLVSRRAVVTAAHCLDGREPDELEVLVDGVARAVWAGAIHPDHDPNAAAEDSFDLAVLTLEADATTTPLPYADTAPAALVLDATVQVVGFGSTGTPDTSGVRRIADANVDALVANAVTTGATGIPCSGDSGGAVLLDDTLVAIVKGSDPDCAQFGIALRTDASAAFLAGAIADADAATASGRPPFDPALDQCAATCAAHADCPLGMLCLPERDGMHCGYRDGRVTIFGETCATGDDCVPVGAGSERDCRRTAACDPGADEPGCCSADPAAPSPLLLALAALGLFRRRLRR